MFIFFFFYKLNRVYIRSAFLHLVAEMYISHEVICKFFFFKHGLVTAATKIIEFHQTWRQSCSDEESLI